MAGPFVVLQAVGPDGQPAGTSRTFVREELLDLSDTSGQYHTRLGGAVVADPGLLTGASVRAVVSDFGVDPDNVSAFTFSFAPNGSAVDKLLPAAHDLADPATTPDYQFEGQLPPVFAQDPYDTNGLLFEVPVRTPRATDPGVGDGDSLSLNSATTMTVRLQLTSTRLYPEVSVPDRIMADQDTQFTARVPGIDPDTVTWNWDFQDGSPVQHGASVTHRFAAGASLTAIVDAVGNGASGRKTFPVAVSTAPVSTPPTTPPAGQTGGAGGSTAPNVGPNDGSGARVGGVPANRPGAGRAGASYDPRSASASASGSPSGAPPLGGLVGYVLSDPDQPVPQQAQAASTPLDDSAPALRAGRTVRHVGEWLIAAAVVVALLLLGAGSERRRPSHTRARRLTRRAR